MRQGVLRGVSRKDGEKISREEHNPRSVIIIFYIPLIVCIRLTLCIISIFPSCILYFDEMLTETTCEMLVTLFMELRKSLLAVSAT